MHQHHFKYKLKPTNIKDERLLNKEFDVMAKLVNIGNVLPPVIQISFLNIDLLDIINVVDWNEVKNDCELIADKYYNEVHNVDAFVITAVEHFYNANKLITPN